MFNTEIKSLYDLREAFPTEADAIKYLEQLRWKSGIIISPYDSESKAYRCGNGRYKCQSTGKYFSIRTGLPCENSKISLRKWMMAIWLINSHKKGISSYQLARDIGVTQKTAWFILHRIRGNYKMANQNQLQGVVECDETFIGGRNQFRHKDKKVPQCQGRSFKDKTPVLGMLQREEKVFIERPHKVIPNRMVKEKVILKDSKLIAVVVKNTKAKTIQPLIKQYVQTGSYLMSDEWWAYRGLNGLYNHKFIDHRKKEYVSFGDKSIHTNTIEGSWKILKDMVRIYSHLSKKHLQKYLWEFSYKYNLRNVSDYEKFKYLLLNSNVRTKYKDLICQY